MRYLSVCSGIEAATSAWHHLGWEPVAFSEIEPFPSAVLKHHYPNVPNWGDMTKYQTWPDAAIDLLVGGTPCQSFSIAGLRKGLEDPRGNLMLTFLGIAQRYRPRYVVWENVPGVLSSNGGRDFGTFLAALGELGYGWAYRVLDAQWFGVAQRRRRVFVVACLGDQRRAAQVLFECESVRRDTPPSRAKGQGAAADAQGSVGGGSAHAFKVRGGCEGGGKGYLGSDDIAFTVATHQDQQIAQPLPFDTTQVTSPANYSSPKPGDPCHPLAAGAHIPAVAFVEVGATLKGGSGERGYPDPSDGNGHNIVAQPVAIQGTLIGRSENAGPNGNGADDTGTMFTLTKTDVHAVAIQDVRAVEKAQNGRGWNDDGSAYTVDTHATQGVAVAVGTDCYNGAITGNVAATIGTPGSSVNASGQTVMQPVAFEPGSIARNAGPAGESDLAPTLRRQMGDNQPAVRIAMQVRRLTPVECERLQGFPDNHTNIPWRGKAEAPDGPRYKALGNSMAVPVMRWIGERINA